jgi:hypothetical protein
MAEPSERDVIQRISRFSSLRATERALRPSVRLRRAHATPSDLGLMLLRDLQELMADDGNPSTLCARDAKGLLADIDDRLDQLDRALDSLIDETPISEFRANLPSIADSNRAETMALLDFCLSTPTRRCRHLSLIDYVITLLSSRREGNTRCLRSDPVQASPGLSALCDRLKNERSDFDAAREFREASFSILDVQSVVPLIERMRSLKADLGQALFAPETLRSVVGYNLAVSNRLGSLLEADRAHDRDIETTLQNLRALDERPETYAGCAP